MFGAGLAPGALTPDLERTHETDAAPWFAAPLVTLPGTDDDTPRGDEPDAAADPFLTPSGDLPDRTPDADVPGEAEAEAEPEDDDTLAGVKLNDTPNDVAVGAEDDVSADADDEAHDDAVDLDGPDDAGDAPGEAAGDPPDDAEDDQDTLVGGAHADAGGVPGAESEPGAEAVPASALPPTGHVVLETNIDDMSAELLAHAAEALREAGALDVWLTPALMKKGRPGTVLHVLAAANEQERLAGVVFAETTTFGLRVLPVGRLYAEERRETVRIAGHDIGVRLGYAQGRLATVSPEYEDCRGAAAELGRPARVVYEAAQARARSRFSGH